MKTIKSLKESKNGFTLVEVIVVLVILAIMAAIFVPAFIGYINKAQKKAVIAECRYCVTSTQGLLTEHYGAGGTKAQWIPYSDEIVKLAEVEGTVKEITTLDVSDSAKLLHLTYTDKKEKYTVEYCAEYDKCSIHNRTYTVYENGSSNLSSGQISDAFMSAIVENGGLKNTDIIDSGALGLGKVSDAVFGRLPANVKQSLSNKAWMVKYRYDGSNGFYYSIYLYDGTLTDNMLGKAVNVTQYNYTRDGQLMDSKDASKYVKWQTTDDKTDKYLVLR